MASTKKSKTTRLQQAQHTVTAASASAWDATKSFAAKPIVNDAAKVVGATALGTLVALGTIKAVNALAAL